MDIKVYMQLPVYAVDIRNEVFVKEQGFSEEYDTDDKNAIHLVGFVGGRSAVTARILSANDNGEFIIGRIAVRKAYRGKGLGAEIISDAESIIKKMHGRVIYIHSQEQAIGFYKKQGYLPIGEPDEEEGCPHQMMQKIL